MKNCSLGWKGFDRRHSSRSGLKNFTSPGPGERRGQEKEGEGRSLQISCKATISRPLKNDRGKLQSLILIHGSPLPFVP